MKNFFGLTSEHQRYILNEQYYVSKHVPGISFMDTMTMPTYVRKMYIHFINQDNKAMVEQMKEQRQNITKNVGKGKRTKTVSGKAVNSFGKSS